MNTVNVKILDKTGLIEGGAVYGKTGLISSCPTFITSYNPKHEQDWFMPSLGGVGV